MLPTQFHAPPEAVKAVRFQIQDKDGNWITFFQMPSTTTDDDGKEKPMFYWPSLCKGINDAMSTTNL